MTRRLVILEELDVALEGQKEADRRYERAEAAIDQHKRMEPQRPQSPSRIFDGTDQSLERQLEQSRIDSERHRAYMDQHKVFTSLSNPWYKELTSLYNERSAAWHSRLAALNQAADMSFEAIDTLLSSIVGQPPFSIEVEVGLVAHPPFSGGDLEMPLPQPILEGVPPEPVYVSSPPPTGILKAFGGKKQRYAEMEQAARAQWQQEHQQWRTYVDETLPATNQDKLARHQSAENQRQQELAAARTKYDQDCANREEAAQAISENAQKLRESIIANDPVAVLTYLRAIFHGSQYPQVFQVLAEVGYDAETREATVDVLVPPPSAIPTIKAYKLTKSFGELRETACPQTEQKNRYNKAIAAVAIRSIFEVFTAEPVGVIDTISLTVGTRTIDPATGKERLFQFVSTAAAREDLVDYDLNNVDPAQTLKRMNALVSKNAFALQHISDARGIRR